MLRNNNIVQEIDLKNENIEKICILMLGLLGDVLMRTPIVSAIKKIYPNARLDIISDRIGKEVLKNNPYVNIIFVIDRKKNSKFKYVYNKIATQLFLIKNRYDLILDLYGGKSSFNMMRLSFTKYQLGLLRDGKVFANKPLIKNSKNLNFYNKHHITNHLFKILKYFDIEIDTLDTTPEMYMSESIAEKIENYINSFEIKNYYILSLGSGGLEKIISMQKMFELIKYIYQKYDLIPAIVLNPGQEYLRTDLIDNFLKPNNVDFIKLKLLSIEEVSILIKKSNFIIVPDTGLFHIAVANGTPIFSIFTYTNPKLVEPLKGIFEIVFKEDEMLEENKNHELKLGTKDIASTKIKEAFDDFYISLKNYLLPQDNKKIKGLYIARKN